MKPDISFRGEKYKTVRYSFVIVKLALIAFYMEESERFMVLDLLFSRIFIKLLGWEKHVIPRHFKVKFKVGDS